MSDFLSAPETLWGWVLYPFKALVAIVLWVLVTAAVIAAALIPAAAVAVLGELIGLGDAGLMGRGIEVIAVFGTFFAVLVALNDYFEFF